MNLAGTATLATLYSDNAYTPLGNPFTSEVDGAYQFYARNGRYDVILTKTGFTFDDDDTEDVLLEDLESVITPAQITSTQTAYNPTNAANATTWRISSDTTRQITGIVAGLSQQTITLVNVGSFPIVLPDLSGASSAANQIITGTGLPYVMTAGASATLQYDLTSTKWRIVSTNTAPSPLILDRQTTTQTVVNSSAATAVYSYSVPGVVMWENRALRLTFSGRYSNTTGGADNFQIQILFGGFTVSDNTTSMTNNANSRVICGTAVIANNGGGGGQFNATQYLLGGAAAAGSAVAPLATIAGYSTTTANTTVANTLTIQVTHATASNSISFSLHTALLELV